MKATVYNAFNRCKKNRSKKSCKKILVHLIFWLRKMTIPVALFHSGAENVNKIFPHFFSLRKKYF
jgi:hypothetical protein